MRTRLFVLAAAALLTAPAALAQQPDRNDPRALARGGLTEVTGWLLRAAEMASQEQYAYRPVATVRTLGELIGHVADSHNYYCARAAGQDVPWADTIEKTVSNKAALIQALRRSIEACNTTYAGTTARLDQLLANVTHDHLHYGNIVTYLRMLGLTPPSS